MNIEWLSYVELFFYLIFGSIYNIYILTCNSVIAHVLNEMAYGRYLSVSVHVICWSLVQTKVSIMLDNHWEQKNTMWLRKRTILDKLPYRYALLSKNTNFNHIHLNMPNRNPIESWIIYIYLSLLLHSDSRHHPKIRQMAPAIAQAFLTCQRYHTNVQQSHTIHVICTVICQVYTRESSQIPFAPSWMVYSMPYVASSQQLGILNIPKASLVTTLLR